MHCRVYGHHRLRNFFVFDLQCINLQLQRLDPLPILLLTSVAVFEVGRNLLDVLLLLSDVRLELLDLEFKRELFVLLLFELLLQVYFIFFFSLVLHFRLRSRRLFLLDQKSDSINTLYIHFIDGCLVLND